MKPWQMISCKPRGLFDIIKEPNGMWLSTVEMPKTIMDLGYRYESCIFGLPDIGSDVLDRYDTQEEAIAGHKRYKEQFGLE